MSAPPRLQRYARRYNVSNALISHGDAPNELAGIRPEPARGVRGPVSRGQRDAGGEAARHESARAESRPEPPAVPAEGSAVHPDSQGDGADAPGGAAGGAAAPGAGRDGARPRARVVRAREGDATVSDRGQQLRRH